MDKVIFNAITQYYKTLSLLGYVPDKSVFSLIVLCFLRNLIYGDYRANISKEDYRIIEKALNCLFGSNCLIPYPDHMKMGELHIGEITELAQRVQNLENTDVLKAFDAEGASDSDIIIVAEDI